jgi:hypothetical protein
MLLRLTVALLPFTPLFTPMAEAQGLGSRQWTCDQSFKLDDAVSGQLSWRFNFDGSVSTGSYQYSGDAYVDWQVGGSIERPVRRLHLVSINMPTITAPSGVYAELYGDDVLVSKSTLLDPKLARRGYYATTSAAFEGRDLEQVLDVHDRWSIVVHTGSGEEIVRRALRVPDRAGREQAFARHHAQLLAAWRARDMTGLETVSDELASGEARCLYSTPQTREAIDMQNFDPLPARRTRP